MAKVWVRALGAVFYSEQGRKERALPGDWIQLGKRQARKLLAQGMVEIPAPHKRAEVQELDRCGVVVRGEMPGPAYCPAFGVLRHRAGEPALPYEYTVIWDPSLKISLRGIEAGLMRLMSAELGREDSWEALAALTSLTTLAGDVGSPGEQRKTEMVVGDLRLPVYDTRLLWIRRTPATEKLIDMWASELAKGSDEQHSFLRALYSSRVMMCTLPPEWQNKQVQWTP